MDRTRARRELMDLMGDLPDCRRRISVTKVAEEPREHYLLEKLMLDLNGIEPVPAYFCRPRGTTGRVPAILYNHAHGGDYILGKDELIAGRDLLQRPPYAEVLAQRGIASFCIDTWAFGERHGRTESEIFKEMLWRGQVMWGMMVFDNLRGLDYLAARPDVDPARIGTLGLSMGSTMAWWTAALDTRIKVTVDICCLTDFEEVIKSRGLDGHGIYYYVPGLLKKFSTAKINSLISPRPHLGLAGRYDLLTPPAGLDKIDRELKRVYRADGAPGAWKLVQYNTGHFESADMRARILKFLDKWL